MSYGRGFQTSPQKTAKNLKIRVVSRLKSGFQFSKNVEVS